MLPSDLDLMIIGEAKFVDVVRALGDVQEALRREINSNLYPRREFRRKLAAGEPFLKRVLADKKLFEIGGVLAGPQIAALLLRRPTFLNRFWSRIIGHRLIAKSAISYKLLNDTLPAGSGSWTDA